MRLVATPIPLGGAGEDGGPHRTHVGGVEKSVGKGAPGCSSGRLSARCAYVQPPPEVEPLVVVESSEVPPSLSGGGLSLPFFFSSSERGPNVAWCTLRMSLESGEWERE